MSIQGWGGGVMLEGGGGEGGKLVVLLLWLLLLELWGWGVMRIWSKQSAPAGAASLANCFNEMSNCAAASQPPNYIIPWLELPASLFIPLLPLPPWDTRTWIPCKLVIPSRFISWKTLFLILAGSVFCQKMIKVVNRAAVNHLNHFLAKYTSC